MPDNTEEIIEVPSREYTPADEKLDGLFAELEKESLDTLEAAARQIITLCTTLLAAFFGLLAIKDVPDYIKVPDVKILATLALIGFLTALLLALGTVIPRRYDYPDAGLTDKRLALNDMTMRKQRFLFAAVIVFSLALVFMLLATLDILLFQI